MPSSGRTLPINGINKNQHALHDSSTTPGSCSDSSLNGEESDYLREYTSITTSKQRRQYKDDHKRIYKTYFELDKFMGSYTKKFTGLGNTLQNEERGSREYDRIQQEIIREYQITQKDKSFQNNKKQYGYLRSKLKHIAQLVIDYDNAAILLPSDPDLPFLCKVNYVI